MIDLPGWSETIKLYRGHTRLIMVGDNVAIVFHKSTTTQIVSKFGTSFSEKYRFTYFDFEQYNEKMYKRYK